MKNNSEQQTHDILYKTTNGFSSKPSFAQLVAYIISIFYTVVAYAIIQARLDNCTIRILFLVFFTILSVIKIALCITVSAMDPSDRLMVLCRMAPTPQIQQKIIRMKIQIKKYLFCRDCASFVKPSSKHCRNCSRCVEMFDHHCVWLNNCIGSINYRQFFSLIVVLDVQLTIFLVGSAFLWSQKNYYSEQLTYPKYPLYQMIIVWVAMLIIGIFWLMITNLVILHIYLIKKQLTTYDWLFPNKRIQPVSKIFSNSQDDAQYDFQIIGHHPNIDQTQSQPQNSMQQQQLQINQQCKQYSNSISQNSLKQQPRDNLKLEKNNKKNKINKNKIKPIQVQFIENNQQKRSSINVQDISNKQFNIFNSQKIQQSIHQSKNKVFNNFIHQESVNQSSHQCHQKSIHFQEVCILSDQSPRTKKQDPHKQFSHTNLQNLEGSQFATQYNNSIRHETEIYLESDYKQKIFKSMKDFSNTKLFIQDLRKTNQTKKDRCEDKINVDKRMQKNQEKDKNIQKGKQQKVKKKNRTKSLQIILSMMKQTDVGRPVQISLFQNKQKY